MCVAIGLDRVRTGVDRARVFDNTLLKVIFVQNQQEATGGNVIRMIYIKCYKDDLYKML